MLLTAHRFMSLGDGLARRVLFHNASAGAGLRSLMIAVVAALMAASASLGACDASAPGDPSAPGWSDPEVPDVPWVDDAPEIAGTLRLVNHPWTTVATLRDGAGLDEAAARALVARRAGPDGISGSLDDRLIRHADELAAVPGVGRGGVELLAAYALARGWIMGGEDERFDPWLGLFDGVQLTLAQAEAVLLAANTASAFVLDEDAGLYASAATEIVARRPFHTPAELAACPGVGAGNLLRLKRFALAHSGSLSGSN